VNNIKTIKGGRFWHTV